MAASWMMEVSQYYEVGLDSFDSDLFLFFSFLFFFFFH